MSTLVAKGMGCYSACAYIFFAGAQRYVEGELGVHQISAQVADLVLAQTTLGDLLDALDKFGVQQQIITVMLRTPPDDMYIFTPQEVTDLGINVGGPVQIADLGALTTVVSADPHGGFSEPTVPSPPGAIYVMLALVMSEEQATKSLDYARERWAGALGGATPEIERLTTATGEIFRVRVPAPSAENANALCAAIKSAGGGCFVLEN
jgi:hypothetical protein